jgi:hypothetical protein
MKISTTRILSFVTAHVAAKTKFSCGFVTAHVAAKTKFSCGSAMNAAYQADRASGMAGGYMVKPFDSTNIVTTVAMFSRMTLTICIAAAVAANIGGKTRLMKKLEEYFPVNYNTYFEPFLGGGSVFFNLK